jgi:hypothetical protein
LVFWASGWLFYLSLRFILRDRYTALVIPVLFLLLPNYSSARFVPFAFMVGLSMVFFFLNLYALLKSARGPDLSVLWAVVSMIALLISGLAYEVALPVFAANLFLVWYLDQQKPVAERLRPSSMVLLLLLNIVGLIFVFAFKALTTTRYHGVGSVWGIVSSAFQVHVYQLGLRLPLIVLKIIFLYLNPTLLVIAILFGAYSFLYLRRVQRSSDSPPWDSRKALALAGAGVVVFALGNAIFIVSAGEVGFTATGVENRTAIAASVGIAICLSGAVMLVSAVVKRGYISRLLFAFLFAADLLATGTLGSFWAAAADQQYAILNAVKRNVQTLPPHTTLLVDGFCPYLGPGIIFQGPGDMGGALQVVYDDTTLQGDVVTPRLRLKQEGIESRIYLSLHFYPYGPNLKVYDFRRGVLQELPDAAAARKYFGITGPEYTFCPPGQEGDGVFVF